MGIPIPQASAVSAIVPLQETTGTLKCGTGLCLQLVFVSETHRNPEVDRIFEFWAKKKGLSLENQVPTPKLSHDRPQHPAPWKLEPKKFKP